MTNNKNRSLRDKLLNLVNISTSDSSIFTKNNLRNISIKNYLYTDDDVENFFDNNFLEIKLNINLNINEICTELLNSTNSEQFISVIDKYEIYLSNTNRNNILKNFSDISIKNNIISYVIKYIDDIKKKILILNHKARQIKKDKGTWNLYLAKYFLKGYMPGECEIINSPIILYPVEIVEENNEVIIRKLEEHNTVNEKLIVFLQRHQKNDRKQLSYYKNISCLNDWKSEFEKIINYPIKIVDDNENKFINNNSIDISKNFKNLVIDKSLCLGIFEPNGGKLRYELEVLLNNDCVDDVFCDVPKTTLDKVSEEELCNDPIVQIDKLDIYQRYAVRCALETNTIIFGPPGTGKSEVITNIIVNALVNNKSVLMVSEKAVALEVLQKRLRSINIFTLSIFDFDDKEIFYSKIKKIGQELGNNWLINTLDIDNNNFNRLKKLSCYNKNIKNFVINYYNLQNYEIDGLSFINLIEEIDKIINFSLFKKLDDDDFFEKINNACETYKIDKVKLFNLYTSFINFVDKYNINSQNDFDKLIDNSKKLSKLINDYKISNFNDLIECNKLGDVNEYLNKFLFKNNKLSYLLKDNPGIIYNDINFFNKIKQELVGIMYDEFFNDINTNIAKIKPFLNYISNLKPKDKRICLKAFLKGTDYKNEKKNFSDIFKANKLDDFETKYLNLIIDIDKLNLTKYTDFNSLLYDVNYFNPINIINYYDNSFLSDKNLEFFTNNFEIINWDWISTFKLFNNNYNFYDELLSLRNIYLKFKDKFPELICDNSLFNYFSKKNNELNWVDIEKIIFDIAKENIISNISNLTKEEKILLQDSIRVANLKRKPSIYQYLQKYEPLLKKMIPIWISRPDQVSTFVPFKKEYFDYGIFDEASQMFLERACSILYRSKINIVAGDDKQLKPTNFFCSRYDTDDDEYEINDFGQNNSLLDAAKSTLWTQVMLKNHYRSKCKELISFSSEYIYDNELNFATINGFNSYSPLELIETNGLFLDRVNVEEANKVIELLNKYHSEFDSILVITFNSSQLQYIENLFVSDKYIDSELIKKYFDGKIEIVNIENVQGNEADLVILSVCYGKKNKDDIKVAQRFGAVIQDGGRNRLNVAITRAKEKMIVIKSLKSSDIAPSSNDETNIFRAFLSFVENVNNKKIDIEFNKDQQLFDSDFEIDVYDNIKAPIFEMNLKLQTQYEVGNKKIDIVILDTKNKVLLGIEVDGWKYHSGKTKIYEDYERQQFLEARGYSIFRILEHEWKLNKSLVINSLLFELNNKLIENENK